MSALRGTTPGSAPARARTTDPYAKLTLTIPGALLFRRGIREAYRVPSHVYIRAQLYSGLACVPEDVARCCPGWDVRARARGRRGIYTRRVSFRGRAAYKIYSRILRRARIFSATVSRVAIFASARGAFTGATWRGRTLSRHVRSGAKNARRRCKRTFVSFLRVFAYVRARPNKFTYPYVRCDTSHLSFVFRCTARHGAVRFEIWDVISGREIRGAAGGGRRGNTWIYARGAKHPFIYPFTGWT